MDAPTWTRVRRLFLEALDHPPGERPAFLAAACPDDDALRAEVEALLAAHDDGHALALEARLRDDDADPLVGARIGPYRILDHLGEGGMGAVYLAERADDQYRQQVALKVVRAGFHDLARRFRRERQILAALEHPHIARLLDGGVTDDGRPYFAMEYVAGQPLTAYCDTRRLALDDRLRLFLTVCDAVQYAHQNLVVHRDLKPSNILVTDEGTVKLLDFGIAKLLDAEALGLSPAETRPEAQLLTPAYAAPEQVRGGTVTTATDVYALGMLLYELLAGHRPYRLDDRNPVERARIICEDTPIRPSSAAGAPVAAARSLPPARLRRRLRGDLDNIVMKALRKEPARRYASAAQLAEDITRHLEGRPVRARRDTVAYRMGKFIGRHRLGVGMTTLMVLLLAGFALVTARQARELARQRDTARLERDKAEHVVQLLADLFQGSDPNQAQDGSITAREILDQGAVKVRTELADQPAVQAQMLAVIGQVYRGLGLYEKAHAALEEAIAGYRRLGSRSAGYATALKEYANLEYRRGHMDVAAPPLREALTLIEALQGPDTPEAASILNTLALVLEGQGRFDEARATLERVVALRRRHLEGRPDENLAANLNNLASLLQDAGDLPAADSLYHETLAMLTALYGEAHPYIAFTYNSIASLQEQQGHLDLARANYERALAMGGDFFPESHPFLTVVRHNLGRLFRQLGDYPAARAALEAALTARRNTLPPDHPDLGDTYLELGRVLMALDRPAEAEPHLRKALDIRQAAYPGEDWRTAQARLSLGRCLLDQARYPDAEPLLREAFHLFRTRFGEDDARTRRAGASLAELQRVVGRE